MAINPYKLADLQKKRTLEKQVARTSSKTPYEFEQMGVPGTPRVGSSVTELEIQDAIGVRLVQEVNKTAGARLPDGSIDVSKLSADLRRQLGIPSGATQVKLKGVKKLFAFTPGAKLGGRNFYQVFNSSRLRRASILGSRDEEEPGRSILGI